MYKRQGLDDGIKEVHIIKPAPTPPPSDPLAYDRYQAIKELEGYLDKQEYDADGQTQIDEIIGAEKKAIYLSLIHI